MDWKSARSHRVAVHRRSHRRRPRPVILRASGPKPAHPRPVSQPIRVPYMICVDARLRGRLEGHGDRGGGVARGAAGGRRVRPAVTRQVVAQGNHRTPDRLGSQQPSALRACPVAGRSRVRRLCSGRLGGDAEVPGRVLARSPDPLADLQSTHRLDHRNDAGRGAPSRASPSQSARARVATRARRDADDPRLLYARLRAPFASPSVSRIRARSSGAIACS